MIDSAISYLKCGNKYIDFEDDMGWDGLMYYICGKKDTNEPINKEDSKLTIPFLKGCWNKAVVERMICKFTDYNGKYGKLSFAGISELSKLEKRFIGIDKEFIKSSDYDNWDSGRGCCNFEFSIYNTEAKEIKKYGYLLAKGNAIRAEENEDESKKYYLNDRKKVSAVVEKTIEYYQEKTRL